MGYIFLLRMRKFETIWSVWSGLESFHRSKLCFLWLLIKIFLILFYQILVSLSNTWDFDVFFPPSFSSMVLRLFQVPTYYLYHERRGLTSCSLHLICVKMIEREREDWIYCKISSIENAMIYSVSKAWLVIILIINKI